MVSIRKTVTLVVVLQILILTSSKVLAADVQGSAMEAKEFPSSIISVFTNPARFHNHYIGVVGYLSTGYEDSNLYLTKDFGDLLCQENSIPLGYIKNVTVMTRNFKVIGHGEKCLMQFHHHYVFVVGIFDRQHMSIRDVSEVRLLK